MDCLVTGCFRKTYAQEYCRGHYLRWYKTGHAGQPFVPRKKKTPELCCLKNCMGESCGREKYRANICETHYKLIENGVS